MAIFIDHADITAKAGNGGNGCVSFHREKFVLNGGPDGGDGGQGGSIVLLADGNMHTLLDFRLKSKYTAQNGEDGRGNRCSGKSGEDLIIKVPVGTVVQNEDGHIIADMYEPGQKRVLLHGGRGGWGNAHFATSIRQAPNFAKPGITTRIFRFSLELKTIADVGLVGFPNVGKSTLLSVLTRAQPKIANYHFTTLSPNLGIVRRHGLEYVIADIPGLVEGAAEGAGLGHDFLRHVERTRLLVHVIDMSGIEGRDPLADYNTINQELERFGDLKNRPQIIVSNKMDLPGADVNLQAFRKNCPDVPVYAVSAAAHTGLDALLDAIENKLRELPAPQPFHSEEFLDDLPDLSGYSIRKEKGIYYVEGAAMERLINSVNFEDTDSVKWFHLTLRRTGVIDDLRSAGAGEGDTVQIEDMQFDFVD